MGRVESIVLYIQMELCKQTLDDYMNSGRKLTDSSLEPEEYHTRLHIAYQIVRGLCVLHQGHRLIHGDLSPRNIYICQDKIVKLGDLGLAPEISDLANSQRHVPWQRPRQLSSTNCTILQPRDHELVGGDLQDDKEKVLEGYSKLYASPERVSKNTFDHKAPYEFTSYM